MEIWYYIKRYNWAINGLFLTLAAYFASQMMANTIVGSLNSEKVTTAGNAQAEEAAAIQTKSREDYEVIVQNNIFVSEENAEPSFDTSAFSDIPQEPLVDDLESPPVKSDYPAKLLGTMVTQSNPQNSSATIEENGNIKDFHIGDKLGGESEVLEIRRGIVVFMRNHHREYLSTDYYDQYLKPMEDRVNNAQAQAALQSMGNGDANAPEQVATAAPPPPKGINKLGNDKFAIEKTKWKEALKNVGSILMDASSVPNFENGKIRGYTIIAMRPGSLYQFLGIEVGDIILSVNNKPIHSVDSALQLFQTLQNEPTFSMEISREGVKQKINYSVQ